MFEPGSQIGRYEVQRRLGRGGMGTVYVAHDPVLGRMVAIKTFASDLDIADARDRFTREARAAAALNHPHIVTIYDFGELDAQPYIVMEYVPGETVAALIRRKAPISLANKLRWADELCAGAGYAHQMRMVHRDIKPANIMIDRSGRLRILDFGIARMLDVASTTSTVVGTPGYMAPEQLRGEPADHRADQFAIGAVFYELMAYVEAFPGNSVPAITHKILTEQPTPLDRLVPDMSPEIVAVISRTLEKNAADRFQDTETLRLAIGQVRRGFETDGPWNTATIRPDDATGTPGRGTGSERSREGLAGGVAQLTPPLEPRRSDRELLAQRRATQIESALQQARSLLAERRFDDALDACQLALTFDETHVVALALEKEISAARGGRDTARSPISTKIAAATIAAQPAVAPAPTPAVPQTTRQPGKPVANRRLMVGAGALLVALGAAAFYFRAGPVTAGSAVVNATPWGTITAIHADNGDVLPLPAERSTPVSLELPDGTYRISITGPPPAAELRQVSVRVQGGATVVVPQVRFRSLTPEEYFDQYLSMPGGNTK